MEQQIAERAKEYARGLYPDMRDWEKPSYSDCRRDYAHGAREQRKIDIDKACECFEEYLNIRYNNGNKPMLREDFKYWIEDFRKAMED